MTTYLVPAAATSLILIDWTDQSLIHNHRCHPMLPTPVNSKVLKLVIRLLYQVSKAGRADYPVAEAGSLTTSDHLLPPRQTDRQTDRETDEHPTIRWKKRAATTSPAQTNRQTGKGRNRQTVKKRNKETDKQLQKKDARLQTRLSLKKKLSGSALKDNGWI